jgi:hypothetical protein
MVLLALLVAACAPASTPRPRSGPAPRLLTRDAEILVLADGRSHFFENRRPHCLAYALEGEWEFAAQPAALRTADRRRFVGHVLLGAEAVGGTGGDLVGRAITQIITDTEKEWGGSVQARVEALPASRPGALLLEFEVTLSPEAARAAGSTAGRVMRLPLRVVAPFGQGLVMVVTALDVADARAVLGTLDVTEEPGCWQRTIRERFPGG